eukprot:gene8260-9109_t
MKSDVKLQIIDHAGHYMWQKKSMELDERQNALRMANLDGGDAEDLSLQGVKMAKEWSFSSAIAGYGFDLLWTGGRALSFLVESEECCQRWVEAINRSLQMSQSIPMPPLQTTLQTTLQPLQPLQLTQQSISTSPLAQSTLPQSFPQSQSQPQAEATDFSLNMSRETNYRTDDFLAAHQTFLREGSVLLPRPPLPPGSSSSASAPSPDDQSQLSRSSRPLPHREIEHALPLQRDNSSSEFFIPPLQQSSFQWEPQQQNANSSDAFRSTSERLSSLATGRKAAEEREIHHENVGNRSNYMESMRNIFALTKEHLHSAAEPSDRPSHEIAPPTRLINEMPHFPIGYSVESDKQERSEAAERDKKLLELSAEVDSMRSRERTLTEVLSREMEARVLRISNENNDFYEASLRTLRLQQERELQALREELQDERQRAMQAIEKETSLRKAAQSNENTLRLEVQTLSDKMVTLEIEIKNLHERMQNDQKSWLRERRKLVADYEGKVASVSDERDRLLQETQVHLHDREKDIKSRYENLRLSELEIARQQWEREKSLLLVEWTKNAQREQEALRAEERKLAAAEIENIRKAFQSRERQTASDLVELEKLHGARVQQLEDEVVKERQRLAQCREELATTKLHVERIKQDAQYFSTECNKKIGDKILEKDQLQRELQSSLKVIDELLLAEKTMKEQLHQVKAEARLLKAENDELRRQLSEHANNASQWKRVVTEQEQTMSKSATAARIATEEVSLLEQEIQRWKRENYDLQVALQKAERLIFGVPQSNPVRKSFPILVDGRNQSLSGSSFFYTDQK